MPEWKVSTPIDTFSNPETGSVIDLVSVVHVGQPDYYRQLGHWIMARQNEGFGVHFEEIADDYDTSAAIGPLQKIKAKLWDAKMDATCNAYVTVLSSSSYTDQSGEQLFYEEGSDRHDIGESTLVEDMSVFAQVVAFYRARRFSHKLEKAANRKSPEDFDQYVFRIVQKGVLSYHDDAKKRRKFGDKTTIHLRNQVALQGVDEALDTDPEAKLVLIWGIGHLAGLRAGLVSRGYEHTERQEINVAVDIQTLRESIQASQKEIDRLRAKVDKCDARTTRLQGLLSWKSTPKGVLGTTSTLLHNDPSMSLRDIENDRRKQQRTLERSIKEGRRRMQEMLQKDEKERQRRLAEFNAGYDLGYHGKRKSRDRSWFGTL